MLFALLAFCGMFCAVYQIKTNMSSSESEYFSAEELIFLASSQSETSSQETQDSSLGLEPYRFEPLQRQYFYLHIWTTANQNETVSRLVCVTDHNRLINPYHVRTFTRSHISRWRYKRGKLFTVSNGLRICDVCTS
jgi:hypothetical protein